MSSHLVQFRRDASKECVRFFQKKNIILQQEDHVKKLIQQWFNHIVVWRGERCISLLHSIQILPCISHIDFLELQTLVIDDVTQSGIENVCRINMPKLLYLTLFGQTKMTLKTVRKAHWPELIQFHTNLCLEEQKLPQLFAPKLKFLMLFGDYFNWIGKISARLRQFDHGVDTEHYDLNLISLRRVKFSFERKMLAHKRRDHGTFMRSIDSRSLLRVFQEQIYFIKVNRLGQQL